MNSRQCVERSLVPKAKVSSTTLVQLLQWLHGKQQQHKFYTIEGVPRLPAHAVYCAHRARGGDDLPAGEPPLAAGQVSGRGRQVHGDGGQESLPAPHHFQGRVARC